MHIRFSDFFNCINICNLVDFSVVNKIKYRIVLYISSRSFFGLEFIFYMYTFLCYSFPDHPGCAGRHGPRGAERDWD